jgi:hypothetical protein
LFERDAVLVAVGDFAAAFRIEYSELRSVQFSGRGTFKTKSGGGYVGGGVGIEGILWGIFLAAGMNALSTKTHTHHESICEIQWGKACLVLQNSDLDPTVRSSWMQPVRNRMAAQQQLKLSSGSLNERPTPSPAGRRGGTGTLPEQIAQLAGLHAAGSMSDEEFAAAKAQVLSGRT